MKVLVIYTSQTGFTKKYAEWITEELQADILELNDAKKKKDSFFDEYSAVIYGGWSMAGNVVSIKWFLSKAEKWNGKKLAVFCVGGCPGEAPEIEAFLDKILDDSQKKYIRAFYCQGGINYDKMKGPSRFAMKTFAAMIRKKKDPSDSEREMAKLISSSYDISDKKFVEPIVSYILDM